MDAGEMLKLDLPVGVRGLPDVNLVIGKAFTR